MSKVYVANKEFVGEDGKAVKYKRLIIQGVLEGIEQTLEIKLSPLEYTFAEMLLGDEGREAAQVQTRKAQADELVSPIRGQGETLGNAHNAHSADSKVGKTFLDDEED